MSRRTRPGVAALATAGALGLAVAAGAAAAPAPATAPRAPGTVAPVPLAGAPTETRAFTARVILPTRLRDAPRADARPGRRLSPYAPHDRGPQVLLVLDSRRAAGGAVFHRVLLPTRPNDASGWVPAEALQVRRTPWRVVVRVGRRSAELLRAGRRVASWPVVVGTTRNPTPIGRFAISEIIPQPDPTAFFGPYIVTLTAHSERLSDFAGGDGRVALHGTSRPQLLGTAASHGCVRMPNEAIRRIARSVPAGSPVEVLP